MKGHPLQLLQEHLPVHHRIVVCLLFGLLWGHLVCRMDAGALQHRVHGVTAAISQFLVTSQTGMKPIPIDSSRRAEHEYTRDFACNGTNKKVMGSQSLQNHKGGPFGRKVSKNYFL